MGMTAPAAQGTQVMLDERGNDEYSLDPAAGRWRP
jgi:hypothetical protein